MSFQGFPSDVTTFFLDLEKNNTKEWFTKNKHRYTTSVLNPVIEFIEEIGQKLQSISKITYDTRSNGQGSILRINRDLRFSTDKTPYNLYTSVLLWEGDGKKNQCPAYGFRIGMKGLELMAGLYMFNKDQLVLFREKALYSTEGKKLENILLELDMKNYQIGGIGLKKIPKGFDANHPRADLLKYKGLYAYPPIIPRDQLSSKAILDDVYRHFEIMSPLQQWLVKAFKNS